MAKGNGNKKEGGAAAPAAYFKSLTIENVKCFKGEHTIDLSDGHGNPAKWTVILGNNNTGKTTILKCLAGLEAGKGIIEITNSRKRTNEKKVDTFSSYIFLQKKIGLKKDSCVSSKIFIRTASEEFTQHIGDWQIGGSTKQFSIAAYADLGNFLVFSYGASRKMSTNNETVNSPMFNTLSLFDNKDLANAEEWILNLSLAEKLKQPKAVHYLDLARKVLTSGILPDVTNLQIRSIVKTGSGIENFVEFKTDFGWIRLHELGYGYQTMITWVLDLVKRMVERYPNSPNPLAEPAIVLVDEIDLHLHPDWQRKIIAHLSKHFPNTQFIVTAHSPLVVQSADEINLVILKKEGDSVSIEQPKFRTFKGWTVEEILSDLMQLEGQTMSQTYFDLVEKFDTALDEDNYSKAKDAFDQLDKILHPTSAQRKLFKLQMTSLSSEATV